ncbi:MAG: hypothetical protein M3303_14790 [Gemmatimonadota bacterium]|nr:hypothetical protein [Gemmatimonadota bacterium]
MCSAQIGTSQRPRTVCYTCCTLPAFRFPRQKAALAAFALLFAGACRPSAPPPSAEFLVSAGDSTYWVRSDTTGVRVRGSPILLARYGGHFYEVYVTDDDRSFTDATFVGQRIYRRDLVSGDSTLVFEDSVVPGMARSYAAANPLARRLRPEEDDADEPATSTTAEVTVLDVHGPYLSYDYHVDVEGATGPSWHATRRGVLDLRTGVPATLATLFGDAAAGRVARQARLAYLAAIDSIFRSESHGARLVAAALRSYAFDDASFAITDVGGAPAVAFHVPGKGSGAAGGITLPLPPIPVGDAPWWRDDVRAGLPLVRADSLLERWPRGPLEVAARYDTAVGGTYAMLAVRDRARRREWPIARVQAPVHHIHWLDQPALDSVVRRSLARAFNEAALYDENVRTAEGGRREAGSGKRTASGSYSMPRQFPITPGASRFPLPASWARRT